MTMGGDPIANVIASDSLADGPSLGASIERIQEGRLAIVRETTRSHAMGVDRTGAQRRRR
jgi:hypothetical protein